MARLDSLDDRDVVLVDGCRTPFQRAGTGFRDAMSYQLAAAALDGLLTRRGFEPASAPVDGVILGATVPNPRTTNVAREAAFEVGLPYQVPAMTMTVAGASATCAVDTAADWIRGGRAEVMVAGGTDCISDAPIGYRRAMRQKLFAARRLRGMWPTLRFVLSLRPWDFLPDVPDITERATGQTMGQYAEGLAQKLGIGRAEQDAYALESHRRATAARDLLAEEIVPVLTARGSVVADNGVRGDTDLATLARLRPSFADDGTLTAGNASFLTDGAAVLLLASARRARDEGWPVLAVLRGSVLTAHDPRRDLLLGPVVAIPRVLAQAGLGLDEIDVVEIHEAFAAQVLAVLTLLADDDACRELGLDGSVGTIDRDKLNAWGGSLAIGNPFAPNGARLLTTAAHRLHHEEGRHALVATCAGGALGQGMLLERVE